MLDAFKLDPQPSKMLSLNPRAHCSFLYQPSRMNDDEGTESPDLYYTGGLHPVHLNDIVSASSAEEPSKAPGGQGYRILHKLGVGSFSHVWFGQNLDPAHPGHRGAALKFITSNETGKTHEVEINRFLAEMHRSRSQDSGSQNFALCLETFQINGPNGIHDVIVTEPAVLILVLIRNNIIEHLDERIVFKQTLSGLGFLHKHGIIHRDLHLNNIAIEFPFMRSASVPEIMKGSGHPSCLAVIPEAHTTHTPSLPKYIVERAEFFKHFLKPMNVEAASFVVKIIDFGRAFRPETHDMPDPEEGNRGLKPPECNLRDMIPKKRLSAPEWRPTMLSANANWPSFVPEQSASIDIGPPTDHDTMLASLTTAWPGESSPLADCAGQNQEFSTSTQLLTDTKGLENSLSAEEQPERAAVFKFDRAWSAYYVTDEEREPAPDLSDLVWSSQGDIWVLACTLFLILVRDRSYILGSKEYGSMFRDIAHFLGPMPDRYRLLLDAGAKANPFYDGQQCSIALDIDPSLSDPLVIEENWSQLEEKVYRYRRSCRTRSSRDEEPWTVGPSKSWTAPLEIDEEERKQVTACLQLIRRMLKWSPEDRISASDAAASLCT